jgi:uncharacterized SAM-binding protein YcdF (DUF218 family)
VRPPVSAAKRLAILTFRGFSAGDESLIKRFADLGGDPSRINMESQSRTTSEDALYSAALRKPKPSEKWPSAMHMPRAVGCFPAVGFQVEPYPVEFMTSSPLGPFAGFATGSSALLQFGRGPRSSGSASSPTG